ncbi:hypothetical protein JCM5350_000072 [Sporobolomyces pararoseus]
MLPNSLLPTLLPKPQFKAVILAGYGIDLFPLVEPPTPSTSTTNNSNSGTNSNENESTSSTGSGGGQTKALLPVGGKKMIDWVIEQIESAGILEVLVLTPQSISKPMSHHLRSRRSTTSKDSGSSKVELEEIPEEIASRGTVRVLMWATEKSLITTDFILLPCDLLLSPSSSSSSSSSSGISLASLLDRHRTDDNLVTTLFSTRSSGNIKDAKKDQQGPVEILTVYDRSSCRLLDVREMDDLEDQDEIPLRTSLLTKYPKPTLTTSLLPTQLYIFSSLILPVLRTAAAGQSEPDDEMLRRLKSFESVKDLVGWLARSNWRKNGKQDLSNFSRKIAPRRNSNSNSSSSRVGGGGSELAMGRSTTQLPSSYEYLNQSTKHTSVSRSEPQTPGTTTPTPALISRTSWLNESNSINTTTTTTTHGTTTNSSSSNMARQGRGGCKVLIWKESDGFCARGNTVSGFVELNRAALKLLPPSQTNFIPTFTPPGVFISPDSFLHPTVYTLMGEKVGIKKCIIGKNCQIGKNSKLTNSVLMEGCVIGENVKLDNCVISNGVQTRDRASLKDCELGKDVIVGSDSQLKGEQLTVGDE